MLEACISDSWYARFDTHSYHCFRETGLNGRLEVKSWQSVKSRSRTLDHSVCLKIMSRTITVCKVWHSQLSLLQRNTLNNAGLDLNNARLNVKSGQSHSSMKSRSRALVHSARKIITQGLTLPAMTASEKCTWMLDSVNCWQTGDGRMVKQMEIQTPMLHPATSRAGVTETIISTQLLEIHSPKDL